VDIVQDQDGVPIPNSRPNPIILDMGWLFYLLAPLEGMFHDGVVVGAVTVFAADVADVELGQLNTRIVARGIAHSHGEPTNFHLLLDVRICVDWLTAFTQSQYINPLN
jgi:hypothetical protein